MLQSEENQLEESSSQEQQQAQQQEGGMDYYQESVKLYYFNCILYNHLEKVLHERNELKSKLQKFQQLGSELGQLDEDDIISKLEEKKKKSRRRTSEIDRQYYCNASNCKKSYGSEATLMQHMKLKHGSTTDAFLSMNE